MNAISSLLPMCVSHDHEQQNGVGLTQTQRALYLQVSAIQSIQQKTVESVKTFPLNVSRDDSAKK